jgi:hypothetical protein
MCTCVNASVYDDEDHRDDDDDDYEAWFIVRKEKL